MISSSKADLAFTEKGFQNWKNATDKKKGFQKHETSDTHREAVSRYVTAPATALGDVGELISPGEGGTPILGHTGDVRLELVTFPGRKPADGCKFFTKNLRMGHNFDIILPGNVWFSSKLNKTYCSLVNFYCK